MEKIELIEFLKQRFGSNIIEINLEPKIPVVKVKTEVVKDLAIFLKNDENLRFNSLFCVSGVDSGANLTVVYHIYSIIYPHKLVIKVDIPRENPKIPSVMDVWLGADWYEREAFDLFGIIFEGRDNCTRLFLPEDWEGYPLRKDYVYPDEYNGIPHKEVKLDGE